MSEDTPNLVEITTTEADANRIVWDALSNQMKTLHGYAHRIMKAYPTAIKEIAERQIDFTEHQDGDCQHSFTIICCKCSKEIWVGVHFAGSLNSCTSLSEMISVDSDSGSCDSCKTTVNLIRGTESTEDMNVDWELIALKRKVSRGVVEWLIPGVMEVGKLAALFGPPKAGKSLLALQWAIEAAKAGKGVLYLDKENDPEEVYARALAMGHDLTKLDDFTYRSFMNWKVDTPEGSAKIIALAEDRYADLVIFDSWAKFITGSQNDDAAAQRAYELTVVPLRKERIGALRLDHSGHGDVQRPAGTVAKLADVDHNWQIKAKPLDGGRAEITLVHRDNRTARGEDTINLIREVEPLRHVDRGQQAAAIEALSDDPVIVLVELMDERGWPVDWPIRKVTDELKKLGQGGRTEHISAAVRRRRESGVSTS